MDKTHILHTLNKHAKEYEFPILDNTNFDLAVSRLTVFTDKDNWALAFEIIGVDSTLAIANDLYVYTNVHINSGIAIRMDDILTYPDTEDLFDAEDTFLINPLSIELELRGEPLKLSPNLEDYQSLNIDTNNFSMTKLVRFLCHKHSDRFFLSLEELKEECGLMSFANPFYQTTDWFHTDEELPGNNEFFVSVADAMASHDVMRIKQVTPNTHWSNWTWSDFENEENE